MKTVKYLSFLLIIFSKFEAPARRSRRKHGPILQLQKFGYIKKLNFLYIGTSKLNFFYFRKIYLIT